MPAIPLTAPHDIVVELFVQVIQERNGLNNHSVHLIWAELEFIARQAKIDNNRKYSIRLFNGGKCTEGKVKGESMRVSTLLCDGK